MRREYKYIVVGAGASGLMFTSLMREKSDILIIDSNSKIGAKIAISGGGKCNITNENISSSNYTADSTFVDRVLGSFSQTDLLKWLEARGVVPLIRGGGEYFCQKSSEEIIALFAREIRGTTLSLDTTVSATSYGDRGFKVETNRGWFVAPNLIVASGGLSFPKIGASAIGHTIASSFGHTITPTSPALVGFTLQPKQFFMKELSGSSLDITMRVGDNSFDGAILFAHRGISGPVVFNTSVYWKKGNISIDFIPTLSIREIKNSKKQISTLLPIPKRVAKALLKAIDLEDKTAKSMSPKEWSILEGLHDYSFAPAGTFGYSKAEVTRGGVSISEIDSDSMMSSLVENLYFLGEVTEVTGELGGYNLQWALSSAYRCADSFH